MGELEYVHIFGDDYKTHDGTGVRDYIHVVDLARGHVKAVENIETLNGVEIINLATGNGYSVFDVIKAFEKVIGKEIPYKVEDRRQGDIDESFADASKAKKVLGWQAEYDIERMCEDAWRWQKNNPHGYQRKEKI